MASLAGDLRFAIRSFRRSPVHALLTVLILGVGLGSVTLMFSVLNASVLRPLPFPEPDRLAWTWKANAQVERNSLSWDDYRDYRDGMTAFESTGAIYVFHPRVLVTGTEEPERAVSSVVTPSLFPTLGVSPALGRGFLPQEAVQGGPDVVVLSHAYWQSRMASDPGAVGRTLTLDGRPAEIVGVMPAGFSLMGDADLWLPVKEGEGSTQGRGNNNFYMVGRLAPDASFAEARAQMATVGRRIQAENPDFAEWSHWLQPLHDALYGDVRPLLVLLLGIVSLVPLVACANVAALSLARATARGQEMATRIALGAGRTQLVRQLLAESVLLALAGGALGLLLAATGSGALRSVGLGTLPRLDELGVDGTVVTFGLFAALLTVPLFGVYPALRGTDFGAAGTLRLGRSAGRSERLRGQRFLVATQVALSTVLMITSGLLFRSFLRLEDAEPGFRVERLLTAGVQLADFKYGDEQALGLAWDQVTDRLRRIPGVVEVGGADWLPVTAGGGPWNDLARPGHTLPDGSEAVVGGRRKFVTEGYFKALGIPILAGRAFGPDDTPGAPPVMILSETLTEALFPGEDAVGQSVILWDQPFQVVGVSARVDEAGLGDEGRPAFFISAAQFPRAGLRLVLRTGGEDPLSVAGSLRTTLHEIDPDIALSDLRTMDDRIRASVAQPRFRTLLVGVFALVTLLLAAFGLYGVLAHLVAQRRQEIGIRAAVGASGPDTVLLVVGEGMRMVGLGAAAGLLGSWALGRVLRGLLFEVAPADPLTFAGVVVLLSLVALAASVVPAVRAVRVSPLEALRAD